jgi:hypothetical protein|nr:MAG: hypothetical protein [Bacteriophage sp.]
MNKIIDSLEVMCEKDNPQDRKLLLLAHLVQDSVKGLAERQQELQGSLSETNRKLDSVLEAITKYKKDMDNCPVYDNRELFDRVKFLIKNPRLSLFLFLGIISLLSGLFGSSVISILKLVFGV